MESELKIETSLGTIVAKKAVDPVHPGLYIDLIPHGTNAEMPLGMVEFAADEGDLPDGKGFIITRVWGDGMQEDYTDRVVHTGIEEFVKAANQD